MKHCILLADDHQLVRSGLRALLERRPDLVVIGEAKDGHEAVRMTRELHPELVVMDVSMPGLNGIEATHQIVKESSEVKVLCLSMHSSVRLVKDAFRAGATGYLLKDSAEAELVQAIQLVLAGRTFESPAIAGTLIGAFKNHSSGATAATLLTGREREVLQLLSEGLSVKQTAERLFISPKTVYTHRESIMEKLEIFSIAGLTRYAIREGMTSVDLQCMVQ